MIDLAERLNGDQPPIALLLGRTIIAADREGHVRLRFEARPEFCNGDGVVQGGLVAAMLALCAVTGFLPMVIVFPWLGLASWRAYREMVAADGMLAPEAEAPGG